MSKWLSKARDLEKIDPNVRAAIKSCLHGKTPWPLFLWGSCGSGKTCAALCVLDAVGAGAYYTVEEWVERCDEARRGRLSTSAGYRQTLTEVRKDYRLQPIIVLDELGYRTLPDREYTNLHWAIDVRDGQPLVCCSNVDLNEIVKVYDDRIASRLRGGTVVRTYGDRRGEQGVLWPKK